MHSFLHLYIDAQLFAFIINATLREFLLNRHLFRHARKTKTINEHQPNSYKTMKLKYSILAASLLGVVAANAAVVSWSSATFTTSGGFGETLDTGQFDTTGISQHLAQNIGGNGLSFDGITWAAGTGTFDGDAAVFHENTPPANTLLAREGSWGNGGSAGTVSLTGLTDGHTYRIQALVYDGRGTATITGRTVEFDGIDQGTYANGVTGVTWGDGLLVTGTFTAIGTTQDFTIEAFDGTTSKGAQLNALTVYTTAVPEPSSAALLGLGGLALILRRRK